MDDAEHKLALYREFRDYIKHEDTLRGSRTGWLLTSQGFLFAAQGAMIDKHGMLVTGAQIIVAVVGLLVAEVTASRAKVQDGVFASVEAAYEQAGAGEGLPNLRFGTAPFAKTGQYSIAYPAVFMTAWIAFLALVVASKVFGT